MTISPLNNHFILKDDKVLFGKSDEKNDEFDILLFACRGIEKVSIPSNIKIISSNAFNYCKKLTKVEIQPNSNLQTIEKNAFRFSAFRSIFIPSSVSKIDEYTFYDCNGLQIIEIAEDSKLESFPFLSSFYIDDQLIIMIPVSLEKLIQSGMRK